MAAKMKWDGGIAKAWSRRAKARGMPALGRTHIYLVVPSLGRNEMTHNASNENAIRGLLAQWAAAVRAKDLSAILADHSSDFLMFDVPPPFQSRGLKAYEDTWRLFYSSQPEPVVFDIKHLEIVAGDDVAFASAHMQCAEIDENGQRIPLDFRLTVGLRKIGDRWTIVHEHHSVPAT